MAVAVDVDAQRPCAVFMAACVIRASTSVFERIWRMERKPKCLKFFLFNSPSGCESHPLRQHDLLCFQRVGWRVGLSACNAP
jgi:hypothetical protein